MAATLVEVMVRVALLGRVEQGRIIACVVIIALAVFSSGVGDIMMEAFVSCCGEVKQGGYLGVCASGNGGVGLAGAVRELVRLRHCSGSVVFR